SGASRHTFKGEFTLINRPSTARPSLFQLSSEGQAASPGRTREKAWFEVPCSARASASRNHSRRDSRGIDAVALSSCLLFMEWSFQFVFGKSSTSAQPANGILHGSTANRGREKTSRLINRISRSTL